MRRRGLLFDGIFRLIAFDINDPSCGGVVLLCEVILMLISNREIISKIA